MKPSRSRPGPMRRQTPGKLRQVTCISTKAVAECAVIPLEQCNRETLRCHDKIENQTLRVHILSIIQEEVKHCERNLTRCSDRDMALY